jgi:hypothetical protein
MSLQFPGVFPNHAQGKRLTDEHSYFFHMSNKASPQLAAEYQQLNHMPEAEASFGVSDPKGNEKHPAKRDGA